MKRWIVLVVLWIVVGVPVVLLLGFLGVPLPFGIAWILAFAAALLIAQQSFLDESGPWPPPPPEQFQRGSDVSRLAWAVDARTGVVGMALRRRVSALADRRLGEYGLSAHAADADEVDAILGPGAHAALVAAEMRRPDLERLLRALEEPPVRPNRSPSATTTPERA
ncbi:hypothetical protein LXM50_00715 [Microbacterium sp. Au-Mic1]|uniref:hypothetical protein n=1 Tax=Microbacterium sp. Au-Mic1 TaxID=2906457 RepID=UPI001E5FD39B|nr:hypothetical protein [Microbacterium sp. Au-Mic1]MCE4024487.1 hypothetical protein [Microbacterium sp. Au-Mic1]